VSRGGLLALVLAAVVPCAVSHGAAQGTRFRSGVAAVRVDALVTDGRRPVANLTASNFELRDNGVLQKILDVQHETLALNVICVLDLSGSVEGEPLSHLKDGMRAVIESLEARDRAALVTFSNRLELHSALTADRTRLRAVVDQVKAGGSTSLFDAVFAGLALRESDGGRTLLLLFSDGRDTSSWLSARKLIDAARRTDLVIYAVTLRADPLPLMIDGKPVPFDRRRQDPGERLLDALADDTGGRVVSASGEGDLRTTFLAVLTEFRQRYVLTYEPSGVAGTGWHSIGVRLRGRSGDIRFRRGYFAR
jgi:Ca-activated chloride channel homolog